MVFIRPAVFCLVVAAAMAASVEKRQANQALLVEQIANKIENLIQQYRAGANLQQIGNSLQTLQTDIEALAQAAGNSSECSVTVTLEQLIRAGVSTEAVMELLLAADLVAVSNARADVAMGILAEAGLMLRANVDVTPVVQAVANVADMLVAIVRQLLATVLELLKMVLELPKKLLEDLTPQVRALLQTVVGDLIEPVLKAVRDNVVQPVLNTINGLLGGVLQGVGGLVQNLVGGLLGGLLGNLAGGLLSGILGGNGLLGGLTANLGLSTGGSVGGGGGGGGFLSTLLGRREVVME